MTWFVILCIAIFHEINAHSAVINGLINFWNNLGVARVRIAMLIKQIKVLTIFNRMFVYVLRVAS